MSYYSSQWSKTSITIFLFNVQWYHKNTNINFPTVDQISINSSYCNYHNIIYDLQLYIIVFNQWDLLLLLYYIYLLFQYNTFSVYPSKVMSISICNSSSHNPWSASTEFHNSLWRNVLLNNNIIDCPENNMEVIKYSFPSCRKSSLTRSTS